MRYKIFSAVAAACMATCSISVSAAPFAGIYILSAQFGKIRNRTHLDITSRLQELCGTQGSSCDVWCSQTSFGGSDPGRHGLCRVIYRCPDGSTHAVEAAREEPILMRCPVGEADDRRAAASSQF